MSKNLTWLQIDLWHSHSLKEEVVLSIENNPNPKEVLPTDENDTKQSRKRGGVPFVRKKLRLRILSLQYFLMLY